MIEDKRTILFVDDEERILYGLRRALRLEPYKVLTAASASDALRLLESHVIDVIVTDEDMPGIRGLDLLKSFKQRAPDILRIMLTGKATLPLASRAVNEGGVYRFFSKPASGIEIACAVREAFETIEKQKSMSDVSLRPEDELEREFPGIMHVDRDESGAVIISDE